uniref:Uncharacterized protein n=1 Tax=Fagus sylvatica TaxID=28930 RepID=A0A2N9G0R5_FAGSY
MFSIVSKLQPTVVDANAENMNIIAVDEEQEVPETQNPVTSHLYIKPTHSTQPLDKEVVLRRIRQRKRVNKVKATFQALVSSPFSAKPDKVSVHKKKWADDAFAAL